MTLYWKSLNEDRFKLNNIVNYGRRYIYEDDATPSKYHSLCEAMIVKLVRNTVIITVLLLTSYAVVGCGALYTIIFGESRITFVGTEIPFVDGNTDIGFLINMMEQSFLTIVSLTGNIAIEIGVSLVHNAFEMIPEIIHYDFEEFNIELNLNGMSLNAKMRLRNIFMKVQDYER